MVDIKTKSSIFSILIILFGILGVISFFSTWFDLHIMSFSLGTLTGWEWMQEVFDGNTTGGLFIWMPLVVLIFSLIAAFLGLSGLLKPSKQKGKGAVACGVIIVLAALIFYLGRIDLVLTTANMSDYCGIGVFLAMAAGVLLAIFGALRATSTEQ